MALESRHNQAMRYRLSTLMIWMAVGPPLLALAWFLLPVMFVPLIGSLLVVALFMLSSGWAELSNEVTRRGREKLRREIAEFEEHDQ